MHKVVVNSTPVIALLSIGRLDILEAVYGIIFIPEAVYRETTAKDAKCLDSFGWINVKPITNHTAKEMFAGALHDGEVETMILAKEMDADLVIMDDGLARRHAKYLGLAITGTVGVLLRAKSAGYVDEIAPILKSLIQNEFYLSEEVYREVLGLAGEQAVN